MAFRCVDFLQILWPTTTIHEVNWDLFVHRCVNGNEWLPVCLRPCNELANCIQPISTGRGSSRTDTPPNQEEELCKMDGWTDGRLLDAKDK